MKKEIFAVLFLILMFVGAFLNIYYLDKLTGEIIIMVNDAERLAGDEKWGDAARKAEEAVAKWIKSDTYTHLLLHHAEIDSVTDALHDMQKEIYSVNSGAALGAAKLAVAHLKDIAKMEHINLGSIF